MRTGTAQPQPQQLYRMFGADEELLYVGISLNAVARAAQHRVDKAWWLNVARIEVEGYPDREAVLTAEKLAIKTEQPTWNLQHNVPRDAAAKPVVPMRLAADGPDLQRVLQLQPLAQPLLNAITTEAGHYRRRVPNPCGNAFWYGHGEGAKFSVDGMGWKRQVSWLAGWTARLAGLGLDEEETDWLRYGPAHSALHRAAYALAPDCTPTCEGGCW